MPELVRYFDPQPAAPDLPGRMPSPFAPGPPHALARRAAAELRRELERGEPITTEELRRAHDGKMMGVLIVGTRDGRVGYLRGFSGMLAGRWHVDGFVAPLFDAPARAAFWPLGEAQLDAYDERIAELTEGPLVKSLRAAASALLAGQSAEAVDLLARHGARRRQRDGQRRDHGSAPLPPEQTLAALHALDQESRGDKAERRRQRARHVEERQALLPRLLALDEERAALADRRTALSCELLARLHAGYAVPGGRGGQRALRELFAPGTPPGGAGDCAAPKLLGHALRHHLRPLALAEFWCGGSPATGGRHDGVFYPACRGKCGPVLGHMLDGLDVEPAPLFGAEAVAADEPTTVFEDEWLVVVDKPAGLLSVPGRGRLLEDSVLSRLRGRYPRATGPLLVHRLDLDTSGLLLAAKDAVTHAALQRQFAAREIGKRYVAWLEGTVVGERGRVDLAVRVDVHDRPRQIHDPVGGKPAVTEWQVLARTAGRTRVALHPITGRTHQLRVHAAHPLGLGAAIVGDRLYGRASGQPGERLLLHAEALAFAHPRTGAPIELTRPAPF